MDIKQTEIDGCFLLRPRIFEDHRGYFFESFNAGVFEAKTGLKVSFVQDNQSLSHFGVLRGLHFQRGKHAQAKLVRVLEGEVLDVAVDLRPESQTYGAVVRTRLSAENRHQLYIPRGCAHGFVTLTRRAKFFYKCDNYYSREAEGGIRFDDPRLNIDWELDHHLLNISEKDLELPFWQELHPLNQAL